MQEKPSSRDMKERENCVDFFSLVLYSTSTMVCARPVMYVRIRKLWSQGKIIQRETLWLCELRTGARIINFVLLFVDAIL